MVYANDAKEAVILAQQKAPDEVGAANYVPNQVQYLDQVPEDWKEYIPYCPDGIKQIPEKCKELVTTRPISQKPVEPIVENKPEPVVENKPEPIPESVKPPNPMHLPPNNPPLNFDSIVAGRRK